MPLQSSRRTAEKKPDAFMRLATSRLAVRLRHLLGLVLNAKTLGVRVAAFDARGSVFLVRHTYLHGWHLPGGGVDTGETAEEAALRELREEGNVELPEGTLRLRSVHFHRSQLRRDHVLLFTASGARRSAPRPPDREIAETGFFPLEALPGGTTAATRRRLAEIAGDAVSDPEW